MNKSNNTTAAMRVDRFKIISSIKYVRLHPLSNKKDKVKHAFVMFQSEAISKVSESRTIVDV